LYRAAGLAAVVLAATASIPGEAFVFARAAATEPRTTAPLHGGVVSSTQSHAFETVVAMDGIRVYLYTDELAPAMVEKASGKAVLKLPGGKSVEVKLVREIPGTNEAAVYFCPMHAEVVQDAPGECEPCGGMKLFTQDRLFGKADLSNVPAQELSAMIRLSGLRGRVKEATFTPAFRTPERKAE
jgi:hypothetical protein